jgi:hypothetical protein
MTTMPWQSIKANSLFIFMTLLPVSLQENETGLKSYLTRYEAVERSNNNNNNNIILFIST